MKLQIARPHIPEDSNFHSHRCENAGYTTVSLKVCGNGCFIIVFLRMLFDDAVINDVV
jgi:hypothetical protein